MTIAELRKKLDKIIDLDEEQARITVLVEGTRYDVADIKHDITMNEDGSFRYLDLLIIPNM